MLSWTTGSRVAMITANSYTSDKADLWNRFVAGSKNGLFLFDRSYMDYHSDRFQDASVMMCRDGELVAIMPANRVGNSIHSHGGLTFGGLITGAEMSTPRFLEVFSAMIDHLKREGVSELVYKTVPTLYHQLPAEEDRYALFLAGAERFRCDVTSAIIPGKRLPLRKGRKSEVKKAQRLGLRFEESDRWEDFWQVLTDNLRRKHELNPVHTLEEIRLLHSRFPSNIRLFAVFEGAEIQAGTVIYESALVAHTQYIGCTETGRETGALDFLIAGLLETPYAGKPFFDFGVSNENGGRFLNRGLIDFKEGFGARSITHDFYRLNPQVVDPEALKADKL